VGFWYCGTYGGGPRSSGWSKRAGPRQPVNPDLRCGQGHSDRRTGAPHGRRLLYGGFFGDGPQPLPSLPHVRPIGLGHLPGACGHEARNRVQETVERSAGVTAFGLPRPANPVALHPAESPAAHA